MARGNCINEETVLVNMSADFLLGNLVHIANNFEKFSIVISALAKKRQVELTFLPHISLEGSTVNWYWSFYSAFQLAWLVTELFFSILVIATSCLYILKKKLICMEFGFAIRALSFSVQCNDLLLFAWYLSFFTWIWVAHLYICLV